MEIVTKRNIRKELDEEIWACTRANLEIDSILLSTDELRWLKEKEPEGLQWTTNRYPFNSYWYKEIPIKLK